MKRNVRALFVSSVVGLLLVVMFGAASAAEPSGEGIVIEGESQRPFANNDNPDLHPESQSVDFEYRYDYEYREYEAIVTVEVALSGRWGRLVSGTAVFRSYYDHTDWDVEQTRRGRWSREQWRAFKKYTERVLSCQDGHEQAHVYDDSLTHNPNSPLSIYDYATELWGIRQAWQCDGNSQTPPPPIGVEPTVCVPEAAPYVDEIADVTTEHFDLYVYPDIGDGVAQAYDFDGNGWQLTRQDGRFEHGTCAEQLEIFSTYTLEILNSPDCEADPIYSDEEYSGELDLAGYVAFVEQICEDAEVIPHPECDEGAAPTVEGVNRDSVSFFYVDLTLANDRYVELGFEQDGGEVWYLAEQYGQSPSECAAQLETFSDYTLAILNSEECQTELIYTAAEQEEITWYVALVEQYCEEWLEQGGQGIVIDTPTAVGTTPQLASLEATPIEFDPIKIGRGHDCKEQIADVMLFLKLSLLRGTVWNAAFYNLQPPYDYSAAQVGLLGIDMGLTPAKLTPIRNYLLLWNGTGNVDNRLLGLVYGDLRPFVRSLANDLGQAC